MVFLGKISYSLYLWHVVIFRLFTWHSTLPPQISFIAKFMITFIFAIGSWFLIEKKEPFKAENGATDFNNYKILKSFILKILLK